MGIDAGRQWRRAEVADAFLVMGIQRRLWLGFGASVIAASCSLGVDEINNCTTSDECVAAFGTGFICAEDGACVASADACETNAACRERNGLGSACGTTKVCEPVTVTARCERTFPENLLTRDDRDNYIVIGNLMDRSVSSHQARENSAELALRQANAEGGLEGKLFGMVLCTIEENGTFDDLERQDAAVASAEWLTDVVGVPAIVGPAASGDTGAVFEAIRQSGVLVISPSATSPALTSQDNTSPTDDAPGLLWRTAPPDSLQGQTIAADILGRNLTDVAVINETGAYGDELVRVFEEELGLSFTRLVKYDDATAIGEAVVSVGETSAEEVLFVSSQTAHVISFLNAVATDTNFDTKTIFLSDSAANSDVITEANEDVFGSIRGTRPKAASGPVYSAFQAAYAAQYGGEEVSQFSFTAQAYDAAWLVLYGIAYATFSEDEITGTTIAKGLRRVTEGAMEIELRGAQWRTAVQAFRAGDRINGNGASGELDYDPDTEETTAPIEVWRIVDDCDGSFELEVIDVGTVPMPKMCN